MTLTTKVLDYIEASKIAQFSRLKTIADTTENSLRVVINKLVKQGKIYNPVRGFYVSKHADPLWVATTIYPGYISLSSAFYLYNLIDEYPFTVFIASEKRKVVTMGGQEFFYFRAKNYLGIKEDGYKVATAEKAIYDSLLHLDLVGAPMLSKALYYATIDSKTFIAISKKESNAFFQRIGYLLSILPSLDAEKKKLMLFCMKRKGTNAYLQGRKAGHYIKDWKLIDNVGKEVLLAWQQK